MDNENNILAPHQIVMTRLFIKRGEGEMRFGSKKTIQAKTVFRSIGFAFMGVVITLPLSIITHSFTVVLVAVVTSLIVMVITDNYSPMEGEPFFSWMKFFVLSQIREHANTSMAKNLYIDLVPLKVAEYGEEDLVSRSIEVGDSVEILVWR